MNSDALHDSLVSLLGGGELNNKVRVLLSLTVFVDWFDTVSTLPPLFPRGKLIQDCSSRILGHQFDEVPPTDRLTYCNSTSI